MIACSWMACRLSGLEFLVLRIVRGVDENRGAFALTQDLDLQFAADAGEFGLHVAEPQALAQGMPIVTGGRAADEIALGIEQRFVAEGVGIRDALYFEGEEPIRHSVLELFLEGLLADEGPLVQSYEAVKSRLVWRVVGAQVRTPHAIGLLEAQRLHGAHAGHSDAEFLAGSEDRIEEMMSVFDGEVQFPTKRPDEIDAQQIHVHRQSNFGDLTGQPRKGGIIQRRVRESCQEVARTRSGNHEAAAAARDIAQ